MISILFQQPHFPFSITTRELFIINLLERARILKMTPLQQLAIILRSLPTQVTATTLMKSPDPDMEVSLDEISGGVEEGQLGVDRIHAWGWEGTDVSREIILKQPDMNNVIKPGNAEITLRCW